MNELPDDEEDRHRKLNDDDRPFTPYERRQIRDLIQADARRQWLVSMIRTIAIWITAVSAAVMLLQDYIKKLFLVDQR